MTDNLLDNYARVKRNIEAAKARGNFSAAQVKLISVTKTIKSERIREIVEAGAVALGENRVQELLEKYPQFAPEKVEWHLIGHLQTNKVKYIIDKVAMIHSLDSIALAEEIEKRAAAAGRKMPVLVQVNVAEEDSKFGLSVEDTPDFVRALQAYPHLSVRGLMTVGPYWEAEALRPVFRSLRELRDKIAALALPGICMDELSMGMSNDYEIAVEEGATMLRVGSAIFGARR